MLRKLPPVTKKDIASELSRIAQEQKNAKKLISPEECLHLADQYIQDSDFNMGIYYLERALQIDADNPLLVKRLACVYIYLELYQYALEQVDHMLTMNLDDELKNDCLMAQKILKIKIEQQKKLEAHPIYG